MGKSNFNPRSPHGERQGLRKSQRRDIIISTHAPRTGSDHTPACTTHGFEYFNPRSPHGERRSESVRRDHHLYFNPRSPHGERRPHCGLFLFGLYFNPRSPHGERQVSLHPSGKPHLFQPTLPARGATCQHIGQVSKSRFQPTLPARGATPAPARTQAIVPISTHAPRTGSDKPNFSRAYSFSKFQPTLPARGATSNHAYEGQGKSISTHAPRTGSDAAAGKAGVTIEISTHAPRTGSDTVRGRCVAHRRAISTHAPRTGSDVFRRFTA